MDPIRLKVSNMAKPAASPPVTSIPATKPIVASPKTDQAAAEPVKVSEAPIRQVTFRTDGGWAHVDLNGQRIANNKFGKFKTFHSPRATHGSIHQHRCTPRGDPAFSEREPTPEGSPIVIRLKPKPALLYLAGEPNGSLVRIAGRAYPRDALTRGDPIHIQLPKGKGRHAYTLSIENGGKVIFEKTVEFSAGKRMDIAVPQQPQ